MHALRMFAAVLVVAGLAAFTTAGEPPVPQVTDDHKALEAWIGTWSGKGDLKPGLWGDGGTMTWTEECTWFEGSPFHVVCRSTGSGPMGSMKGLGVIGYNAEKGVYTHYGVDSTGWSGYAEGTRTGNSYTFKSTEMMGGSTYHSRFTMDMTGENTMEFSWALSEDGSTYTVLMDGTSTKK